MTLPAATLAEMQEKAALKAEVINEILKEGGSYNLLVVRKRTGFKGAAKDRRLRKKVMLQYLQQDSQGKCERHGGLPLNVQVFSCSED